MLIFRCWISDKNGAIWAFTGPVIVILLVRSLYAQYIHAKMAKLLKCYQEDMYV